MRFPFLVVVLGLLSGCSSIGRSDTSLGAAACPPAYNGCFAD